MDISVVISTFNRSQNLPDCIAALDMQKDAESVSWEAVVVDNNSNDDTPAVVARLKKRYAYPIRYLFEPRQGLSHARNCGITQTRSKYVAFIDDDILVEPQWLRFMCDGFRARRSDAVGGRIRVESPRPIPKWIQPEMYGFLGQRDFGDEGFYMDGIKKFPFGGNMAVRRTMIDKVGVFDTRMGRKGEGRKREELFKGEETDYFRRLAEAGGRIYYEPNAVVRHRILPYQLEKKFFRTLHFNAGFQNAQLDTNFYPRTLGGVPLFLFLQTVRAAGRYLLQTATKGPNLSFRQQMNVGYFLGMIQGYRKRNCLV